MALETCGSCLSCLLIPLALWSIVVNILLYFPNGKAAHAATYHLPNYVWYFEGICFSGVMILLLAVILITLECSVFYRCCQSESCNKTYRSFISIVLTLLGVAFSGYSCIIFTLGLIQGPFCNSSGGWDYIFKDTAGGYLTDYPAWSRCTEPANIVEWNTILLSILIALSGMELIICLLKVAAELKRTLCGTYSVFVQKKREMDSPIFTMVDLSAAKTKETRYRPHSHGSRGGPQSQDKAHTTLAYKKAFFEEVLLNLKCRCCLLKSSHGIPRAHMEESCRFEFISFRARFLLFGHSLKIIIQAQEAQSRLSAFFSSLREDKRCVQAHKHPKVSVRHD
ncbi:transmembrane 4 L6 family member 18 [Leptosomus discolor]